MQPHLKFELVCPASDHDFWLHWLLAKYESPIDVMPIHRYGLNSHHLSRQEQVQGYAHFFQFQLLLTQEQATALKQGIMHEQKHTQITCYALQNT